MEIKVRQGDSLWYYSQLFKMKIELIIDSNFGIEDGQLFIGQRIKVPGFVTINLSLEKGRTRRWSMILQGLSRSIRSLVTLRLAHLCLEKSFQQWLLVVWEFFRGFSYIILARCYIAGLYAILNLMSRLLEGAERNEKDDNRSSDCIDSRHLG